MPVGDQRPVVLPGRDHPRRRRARWGRGWRRGTPCARPAGSRSACAGSAPLRTCAACHARFRDLARAPRSGPQAALTASRWNASTSILARSANGWHFATSLRVVRGAGQVVEAAELDVDPGGLEPQDRRDLGTGFHHAGGARGGRGRRGLLQFTRGAGSIDAASSAPDADAGSGRPSWTPSAGLSSSSGTGAAFMSWVPDRPAASAGVVLHFSHLMSGRDCRRRRGSRRARPCRTSRHPRRVVVVLGLVQPRGELLRLLLRLLDRLVLVLGFRVLGDLGLGFLQGVLGGLTV